MNETGAPTPNEAAAQAANSAQNLTTDGVQTDKPDIRPGEEGRLHDPIAAHQMAKAEQVRMYWQVHDPAEAAHMAHAEKPYRDSMIVTSTVMEKTDIEADNAAVTAIRAGVNPYDPDPEAVSKLMSKGEHDKARLAEIYTNWNKERDTLSHTDDILRRETREAAQQASDDYKLVQEAKHAQERLDKI